MKEKNCLVCKHNGFIRAADEKDILYQENGNPFFVDLCYAHSVEFFKLGQRRFVNRYRYSLTRFLDYERSEKGWFG
jgi:hypothetical protein